MWGTNLRNDRNEKTLPKNHFFGAWRDWNGAEMSRPWTHIDCTCLISISEPIWRVNRGGAALFWGQKWPKSPSPSPLVRSWFFDTLYNFWSSINWLKKGQILRFWPLSTSSPKLRHNWILTPIHPHSYVSNPLPNWADWPSWTDFGQYQA